MTPKSLTALAAVLLLAPTSWVAAQEGPEMSEEAAAAMNAWMEVARPGKPHEHLARYAGRWESEIKMWMEPGTEPVVSPAISEARMVLGGRYLEWVHSGVLGGMLFEAMQLDGYNNGAQRFETIWADNFGTLIINYTGSCQDDCAVRTMRGEFVDPLTGDQITQRAVYTWVDEDNWRYESYLTQGGTEFRNMEIHYTRLSGPPPASDHDHSH